MKGLARAGWYCFGEYDVVIICDVPNNESMSAIALAVAAGGAAKASKTTVLMSGSVRIDSPTGYRCCEVRFR
jgi:uncharacterized protein with GYD domain